MQVLSIRLLLPAIKGRGVFFKCCPRWSSVTASAASANGADSANGSRGWTFHDDQVHYTHQLKRRMTNLFGSTYQKEERIGYVPRRMWRIGIIFIMPLSSILN